MDILEQLISCNDSPVHKVARVSIPWSEERHKEKDRVILDNPLWQAVSDKLDICQASQLLNDIVVSASDLLNQEYASSREARNLISANPFLLEELHAALTQKTFATIRKLQLLQRVQASTIAPSNYNPYMDRTQLLLSQAFNETNYIGDAVKAFKAYLTVNCKAFAVGDPSTALPYYGKYCEIVQSSGTGKSRLIAELAKSDVFVVYVNLRPITDNANYPLRDEIPSNLLDATYCSRRQYELRCSAFFAALFIVIKRELLLIAGETGDPDPQLWCELFGLPESSKRLQFFESVQTEFHAINKKYSDRQSKNAPKVLYPEPFFGSNKLRNAYKDLIDAFPKLFEGSVYAPQLVLALDEAACLRVETNGFIPSHLLCNAISIFSKMAHSPIWVVFVSTKFRVADFTAPNLSHYSGRFISGGDKLFPPYTELGFDQLAPPLASINLDDIGNIDHIHRFGRPLWSSVMHYLDNKDVIERTVQMKLLRAHHFFAGYSPSDQSLAVLAQRFGLDVVFGHPRAVEYLEKSVASHLRICITTTEDRAWLFTSYPSEPLLSHAAAQIMWQEPHYIEVMLCHLKMKLESGMFDEGGNGELVCRILLLLAKDACAQQLKPERDLLLHCRSIPVGAWLEQLFGANAWPVDELQRKAAQEAFQNATINFSHWVALSEHIRVVKGRGECDFDAEDWTKRHFVRTSAVQCTHDQPRVDQMIPLRFTDRGDSAFSQIFVSDQVGDEGSPADVSQIIRTDESIHSENGLPWIAISLDLGAATEFQVTYSTHPNPTSSKSPTSPCLRIYAAGSTCATFPFLTEEQEREIVGILRKKEPRISEQPLAVMREQEKFGSTNLPRNMCWKLKGEHGKM